MGTFAILSAALLIATSLSADILTLQTRQRVENPKGSGIYVPEERTVRWKGDKTAIVICDMWDRHWCKGATERVGELAPVMNEVVSIARKRGALIIHAPSETMEFYKDSEQRKRAQSAPAVDFGRPLGPIGKWRGLDRTVEGPLPIDDSDGGCDDVPKCKQGPPYPWKRQTATIEITPEDAITDKGEEVHNLLQAQGIDNVIVMGVHANMCVLGRSFAIRQLVKLGKNVVLMRDMTDTMYCSRQRPYVNHFRGTDLVVEHIEKFWCPSTTSADLTGKPAFTFKQDVRPRIAVVVSEDEYNAKDSLLIFAIHELEKRFGFSWLPIHSSSKTNLPGIEHLAGCDAAIFYLRRRTLPEDQLKTVKDFVAAQKPIIALRTTSHGFQNWLEFDREVLGGNYNNHYGKPANVGIATQIKIAAEKHPILGGVEPFGSSSWLYKVSPLADTATALLTGEAKGHPPEPVAWINEKDGRRVFYTSLGHFEDFQVPAFRQLLVNGTLWAIGQLGQPPAKSQNAKTRGDTAEAMAANPSVLEHIKKFKGRGQTMEAGEGARPLSPAESQKRFRVPEDLQITLAVREPDVRQPVCMNFDARGRMWVVQYLQYPFPAGLKIVKYDEHLRAVFDKVPEPPPRGVPGADQVTIYEDKDRDGYYESQKDFVTGLNIATSALPGRDGVWVMNPPYLLFYPDKNHDDKPDGPPEVHLSGFGLEDTHAVANSLTWGPDGWLYGAQGSTCTAEVKGKKFLGQAIWRYNTDTREFQLFAEGGGNTFCVEFDRWGRVFSGTNWDKHRGLHFVHGGYYVKNWGKHGPLTHPHAYGFFSHMPHEGDQARFSHSLIIYEEGALPERYEGKMFSIVPLKNRVQVSELLPHGSTFRTRDTISAVETDDKWFRPVDIKAGPDGAIYLADWYDIRLTHVDPRDNWDRSNGRIWRIASKGDNSRKPTNLEKATTEELVATLGGPSKWARQQARQLLLKRPSRETALENLLRNTNDKTAWEALSALHNQNLWTHYVQMAGLAHRSPKVRQWAVRLLGDSPNFRSPLEIANPNVGGVLVIASRKETNVSVRAEFACAARKWNPEVALPIIEELLKRDEDASDPHIPLLLWWAIEAKAISNPHEVLALVNKPEMRMRPLVFTNIVARLVQRYANERTSEALQYIEEILAATPNPEDGRRLLHAIAEAYKGGPAPEITPGLQRQIAMIPADAELSLLKIRLGAAADEDIANAFDSIRGKGKATEAQRLNAIKAVAESKVPRADEVLLSVVDSHSSSLQGEGEHSPSSSFQRAAIEGLQFFDSDDIGRRVSGLLTNPAVRRHAINLLSKRPSWSVALLQAIDSGRIASTDANFDVVQRMRLYQNDKIQALLAKHFDQKPTSQPKARIGEVAAILREGQGDSGKGKSVFASLCASCHILHGQGTRLGPDLTGYERDNLDMMLLSIIDPNAAIREEFTSFDVRTKDGLLLTGFIVERGPNSITVEDGEQGRVSIDNKRIASMAASPISRMPEGLLDALNGDEISDLFAYLRSSGAEAAQAKN